MNNKGLFKIWYSKPYYFVFGKRSCYVQFYFTLSQFLIGLTKEWCYVTLNLAFATILIQSVKCKDRETALKSNNARKKASQK